MLGAKWTDVLSGLLSPMAMETLDRIDARRDPELTCDPALLREALSDHGLPVFESVLEYESRVGSVVETIRLFDDGVNARQPLTVKTLARHDGKLLLPIGLWSDPFYEGEPEDGLFDYLMDTEGTCYVKARSGSTCMPLAESYLVQIEQYAAGVELHEMMLGERPFSHWRQEMCVYYADMARDLAGRLNVPAIVAATDKYGGTWSNWDFFITYQRPNLGGDATSVRLTDAGDAPRVIREIYQMKPSAHVTWSDEFGAPPSPDEPIVDRLPAYGFNGERTGEFLLVGTPGAYRLYWT